MLITFIKNATCRLTVIPGIALSLGPRHPFLVLPQLLFSCLCFTCGHKYIFCHVLTENGTICMVLPSAHWTACQWLFTFQFCLPHLSLSCCEDVNEVSYMISLSILHVTVRYDVKQWAHNVLQSDMMWSNSTTWQL